MIRDLRPADLPHLYPLLERHFPAEQRLLGWRPAVFNDVLHDLYRPHVQFLVRLVALFGRPIYRVFVVAVDGRLAATTVLTYTARAGYVSTVMVDDAFRRRGFARRLLEAAAAEARRRRRRSLVLDVLETNEPARRLYERAGFRLLRRQEYRALELTGPPTGAPASAARVRPLRRSDQARILATARRALPPAVAEVLPIEPRQMFLRREVLAGLRSAAEVWVAPVDGPALGFVRLTMSEVMVAANLSCPVLDPSLDEPSAEALVATAVGRARGRGAQRILCEVPDSNERVRALLARAGFSVPFTTLTLVREL